MRIAVGFEKRAQVRFVSHLDLQRALQRAMRRAGLPLSYTQGFNPHPQLSLASALAVGAQSREEWLEVYLTQDVPVEHIRTALAEALPPGLALTKVEELPEIGKALMALVGRVTYTLQLAGDWDQATLDGFMAQNEILVEKRSKKGSKIVSIRPMLLRMVLIDGQIEMITTHGEGWSVKPELVLEALGRFAGREAQVISICRTGMYAGREGTLRPLIEAAKEDAV